MSNLNELVRDQVMMELPPTYRTLERAINETINSWTNAELLGRISDALRNQS